MFRIPKKFKIGGMEVDIEMVDYTGEGLVGDCDVAQAKIGLATKDKGKELNADYIGQTYCHELIHMLFLMTGERELSGNETLVDKLSILLHQVLKTSVYGED